MEYFWRGVQLLYVVGSKQLTPPSGMDGVGVCKGEQFGLHTGQPYGGDVLILAASGSLLNR